MAEDFTFYVTIGNTKASPEEILDISNELIKEIGKINGVELSKDTENKSGIENLYKLAISVLNAETLNGIGKAIMSWSLRDRSRTLSLRIGDNQLDVSGLSKNEQRELIKWFQIQTGMAFEK